MVPILIFQEENDNLSISSPKTKGTKSPYGPPAIEEKPRMLMTHTVLYQCCTADTGFTFPMVLPNFY
jgi:hypothetical protein